MPPLLLYIPCRFLYPHSPLSLPYRVYSLLRQAHKCEDRQREQNGEKSGGQRCGSIVQGTTDRSKRGGSRASQLQDIRAVHSCMGRFYAGWLGPAGLPLCISADAAAMCSLLHDPARRPLPRSSAAWCAASRPIRGAQPSGLRHLVNHLSGRVVRVARCSATEQRCGQQGLCLDRACAGVRSPAQLLRWLPQPSPRFPPKPRTTLVWECLVT